MATRCCLVRLSATALAAAWVWQGSHPMLCRVLVYMIKQVLAGTLVHCQAGAWGASILCQ